MSDLLVTALPLPDALHLGCVKIARALAADRCSMVIVDEMPGRVRITATCEHPEGYLRLIELAKYPEIERALRLREVVKVDDARSDPLLESVRHLVGGVGSILVQPLACRDEQVGVLFVRRSAPAPPFSDGDQLFLRTVASGLSNLVYSDRLQARLNRKREDLESAYIDRYRELVDANQRLKDLNRFKDDIIAVCSHDLRGPLNVLLGHARLLQEAEPEGDEWISVQAILRQGKRLVDLVETLLDRSRGENARLAIEPTEIDLAPMCRELANEHQILAAEREIRIAVEAPAELKLVADRVKVRQILQNLLSNAITHARDGGQVKLTAWLAERPDGDLVRVSVADDGRGIPVEEIPVIFERYRRGATGIGIGLSICREFVELHGGEIWAESGPDRGSVFHFSLPLAHLQLPGQGLDPTAARRPRVLLVEDEPETAAIAAEILRTRYRVDLARDGAEAIAKVRTLNPDLVLMDVFLPRVDGLDAVATIKAAPDTRHIPIILASAHRGVAEKVRALDLGAVDYLAKPFQAKDLLARVSAALANSAGQPGEEELRRAGLDPATGVLERAGFLRRFAQELVRAKRYGRPLPVAVFQPASNLAPEKLRAASGALKAGLRNGDILCHLGGGRFAACLLETEPALARTPCDRVAAAMLKVTGTAVAVVFRDAASSASSAEEQLAALLAEANSR